MTEFNPATYEQQERSKHPLTQFLDLTKALQQQADQPSSLIQNSRVTTYSGSETDILGQFGAYILPDAVVALFVGGFNTASAMRTNRTTIRTCVRRVCQVTDIGDGRTTSYVMFSKRGHKTNDGGMNDSNALFHTPRVVLPNSENDLTRGIIDLRKLSQQAMDRRAAVVPQGYTFMRKEEITSFNERLALLVSQSE